MSKEKLKIYNSLTNKIEDFVPIYDNHTTVYSCGPTTYDLMHIGNARALLVGDLIYRVLETFGYNPRFVRNFTDVDDKIIKRANDNHEDAVEYASKYVNEATIDMTTLKLRDTFKSPKVSDHIQEIVDMISLLLDRGFAYSTKGGVFFDTEKYKEHAISQLVDIVEDEYSRLEEKNPFKRNQNDFILWKPKKEGEVSWTSPFGEGRPGWHIECSAMIRKYLGDTIDIHHGGGDLTFPHHHNEIQQSEAATGKQFVNYWIHNDMLNLGAKKMSKSEGNMIFLRDFMEDYDPLILRYAILSHHYRSKVTWNDKLLRKSVLELEGIHIFYNMINNLKMTGEEKDLGLEKYYEEILHAFKHDLHTNKAISTLFVMINVVEKAKFKISQKDRFVIKDIYKLLGNTMGIIDFSLAIIKDIKIMKMKAKNIDDELVEKLIVERKFARNDKNWQLSDEIRDKLVSMKVKVLDNPDGSTTWDVIY